MKLVIAIVQDKDVDALMSNLVEEKIGATKLASTGGFLREGNSTFLIGVKEEMVDKVLTIIKQNCQSREQVQFQSPVMSNPSLFPVYAKVGGATVFVIDIDKFNQF